MKKNAYLGLSVLGVLLPYWQFLPWAAQNGLNLPLFVQQLSANRIGAFFGMDVLVSAIALLVFVRFENSRTRIPGRWLPLIAVLTSTYVNAPSNNPPDSIMGSASVSSLRSREISARRRRDGHRTFRRTNGNSKRNADLFRNPRNR